MTALVDSDRPRIRRPVVLSCPGIVRHAALYSAEPTTTSRAPTTGHSGTVLKIAVAAGLAQGG